MYKNFFLYYAMEEMILKENKFKQSIIIKPLEYNSNFQIIEKNFF